MNRTPPGNHATRARILLVDQLAVGLRVRGLVLEELGFQVTPVRCADEAFERFCAESFDLVVTDYTIPKLDGIELTARIREKKPGIPVILISGFAEALGLNESNTGADVVIQKNCYEVTTLTRAVTRLLARRPPKKPVQRHGSALNRGMAVAK